MTELQRATLLLLAVQTILVAGRLAADASGISSAVAAASGAGLLAATRRRGPRLTGPGGVRVAALGVAAGLAGFPVCVAAIAAVGLGLGLRLPAPEALAHPPPAVWLAALGIAPFLEEALFRERLLLALRGPLGPGSAVLIQGACFAALHGGHAWSLLGTFLVGLLLGAVALATRSLALCAGLHAGLNAAAWALLQQFR